MTARHYANRALELHDSEVVRCVAEPGTVVLELSGYVHESPGVPGVDPGTGWNQRIIVTVVDGALEKTPPCEALIGGRVIGADIVLDNVIALPFSVAAPIELVLEFREGEIRIAGAALTIEAIGDATYVDSFPGGS